MKFERLHTYFLAMLLAIGFSISALGCAVTGFDLPLESPAAILGILTTAAVIFSLLYSRRQGGILILALLALSSGYLWHQRTIISQSMALAYHVSLWMDQAYHWGYLLVPDRIRAVAYMDEPIVCFGLLLECCVCRSIVRRKSPMGAILLAAVPLILCLMVPQAVPELWTIFLLFSLAALLLLPANVRRESVSQGNRLTAALILPVLAAVWAMLYFFPQETYVDHTEAIRQSLAARIQEIPQLLPEAPQGLISFSPQEIPRAKVDLSSLNGQDSQKIPILKVTSQKGGTLYLRGQGYETYTGAGWESTTNRAEEFSGWGNPVENITVCTFGLHELLYVPYFPDSGTVLKGGMLPNDQHQLEYTFARHNFGSAISEEILSDCLKLPSSTLKAAKNLLPEASGSIAVQAEQIRKLVSETALYDRSTPRMPASESDFAIWFLKNAKTGYCVHFATAATVLLRASGIPARYVTGYKAETTAGVESTVTSLDAHAWAEYYDPSVGNWLVLEATPADLSDLSSEPKDTDASVPVQSQPEPTTAPPTATDSVQSPTEELQPAPHRSKIPGIVLLALFGAAVIFGLRRWMLLLWWNWKRSHGSVNQRALVLWQESARLSALLKKEPPEEVLELAEKARFSQYTLEEPELENFINYNSQCLEVLQKKPWYFRLFYQFFLGKY